MTGVQARKIVHSAPALCTASADSILKTSPKIEEIANNIAQLNLIEVAELTDLLKKKLNLPDAPMMGFAGIPAAAAAPSGDEQAQNTQTSFSVKLLKFDDKQKVALIKEIKSLIDGMNLVQAKKFVESAPVFIREDIGKVEAEKLKEALTKIGAEVEIV
ncbi:hypothetical protein RUM44_012181 [Polyplax serrata]|uniref:39S ribosomal protein L12, mitochondrial n=1 Tax=Polyplax serrata TaxID=468196 RepID=A0ABR1BAK3_POLSC